MRTLGEQPLPEPAGHVPPLVGHPDEGFRDAYISRIGLTTVDVSSSDLDDHQVLERVIRAQLATIPFENLMIHANHVVDVDPAAIERKIIGNRRGGICYEVNGLLARGLQALGFGVHLIGAAVARDHGQFGPALGHMVVLVTAGDRHWLVDTGFGGSSVLTRIAADQIHSPVDIATSTGKYRTDGTTHRLVDFTDIAHWQSTSPDARFTGSIICSITDDAHRITMSRSRSEQFALTRTDLSTGERHHESIADDAVCAVFDRHFEISLETPPVVANF
jgi:N-hydroxyarylamine O-acetyltransferase